MKKTVTIYSAKITPKENSWVMVGTFKYGIMTARYDNDEWSAEDSGLLFSSGEIKWWFYLDELTVGIDADFVTVS